MSWEPKNVQIGYVCCDILVRYWESPDGTLWYKYFYLRDIRGRWKKANETVKWRVLKPLQIEPTTWNKFVADNFTDLL